jgi:hypothetical protein
MTTIEYLQTPETVLPRELAFGVLGVGSAGGQVIRSCEWDPIPRR